MERKTLTIALAVALIVSFFLAFVGRASGMDVVFKPSFLGAEKYVLLLIPVAGVLLLFGALNDNFILSRGTLGWLAFLAVLFWVIGVPLVHHVPFNQLFKGFGRNAGAGFWMAAVASIILVSYDPRN